MLRRGLGAALVMLVLGGFLFAGRYTGLVNKIEDGKVTAEVSVRKGNIKSFMDKTFKLSKDAKFIIKASSVGEKDKEIKVEDVKKLIEKAKKTVPGRSLPNFGTLETMGKGDDETVTKITFGGPRKGKSPPKEKDE
jgi:hypothetical protein